MFQSTNQFQLAQVDLRSSAETEGSAMPGQPSVQWGMGIQRGHSGTYYIYSIYIYMCIYMCIYMYIYIYTIYNII